MKLKKFLSSLLIAVLIGATTVVAGDVANLNKQLLIDGNMERVGVGAEWTTVNNPTLTKETTNPHGGNQVLRIAYNDTSYPGTIQDITTIGKTYRVTGWYRSDGATNPRIWLGTVASSTGSTSTTWQYFDFMGLTDSVSIKIYALATGAGYAEYDDIVVTEIQSGDWKNTNKQLLVDGNMERVNTTAYTASGVTLTKETTNPYGGDQILKVEKTGASTGSAYQNILTIGKTYRVTGWGRGDGTAEPRIGDTSYRWEGTNSTSWQYFDVTFISNDGNFHLYVVLGGTGNYVEFDDVVVTEVQHGDAKNPYKQILVDGNMERAVTTAWSGGNNAILTKETTNPHGGNLTLKIAHNSTFSPYARQAILTSGKRYRVTGWAHGDGSKAPKIIISPWTTIWSGGVSEEWQYIDEVFISGGTGIHLVTDTSAVGYSVFDDIVVTEY